MRAQYISSEATRLYCGVGWKELERFRPVAGSSCSSSASSSAEDAVDAVDDAHDEDDEGEEDEEESEEDGEMRSSWAAMTCNK